MGSAVEFLLTRTGELEDRLDETIHTGHSSPDEVLGFRDVAVQGLSDLRYLARLQVRYDGAERLHLYNAGEGCELYTLPEDGGRHLPEALPGPHLHWGKEQPSRLCQRKLRVQVHTVGLTQAVPDKVSALRTGCSLGRENCIRHARSK
jgi:hypothetical protein